MTTKKKVQTAQKVGAVHYTEPYLINPQHPVTVNVIGCGGTGSQVLTSLARMDSALRALGHTGLFVRAIDNDKVSEANMGRQLFSPADVGEYKSTVLISRINRFFSLEWESRPELYKPSTDVPKANITISCVDSASARKQIKEALNVKEKELHWAREEQPYERGFYWMDFGNMKDRGQMVIGTLKTIKQPESKEYDCVSKLATIDELHPDIMKDEKGEDQGPSCSLAEALGKQDLFINTNLANMGLGILWKMFREARISYHGLYLNLDTMSVNPIKIQA